MTTSRASILLASLVAAPLLQPAALRAQDSSEEAEAAALEAAEAWLALLDAEEIDETWEQAAEAFRSAVTVEAWRKAVADAVGPFAPLGNRTLIAVEYYPELPNAPPGEYVAIQYRTVASGNRPVIETVTPMKDPDGVWRVSGYYIRPE